MIAYVLGGVVLASTPVFYLVLFPGVKLRVRVGLVLRSVGMAAACLLGGVATGFLDGPAFLAGSLLVGAVAAGLVSKDRMWTLIFTLAAMGASGTLLWWKHDEAHTRSLDFNQVVVFFAAALVVFVGSLIPMRRYCRSEYIIVFGIGLFMLQHSLNTSVLDSRLIYEAVRHHWDAYIGPSETILSGFTMIAGLATAAGLVNRRFDKMGFGSVFVCLLSLYAVFSYYIGRSHDNNILNLMPYLVLVLACVQSFGSFSAMSRGARAALASVLALVISFGWSAWHQTSLADYANEDAVRSMSYVVGSTAEQTGAGAIAPVHLEPAREQSSGEESDAPRLDIGDPLDAARAVFYVSSVRREPLIKIDDVLETAPIGPRAWSAIHDPIDFYFLPDTLVIKLIDRTMLRLKSPGWLVIAKKVDDVPETLRWQRLLAGPYVKTEEMDFGAYHAIRYEPNLR